MSERLLSYYGDDLTGSTDVMEALTLGGLPTVLFLQPPTDAQLDKFADCRAFGIAGISRSMSPVQMDAELVPAFTRLAEIGARFVHYKVCSTFDSSPTTGSIGHAIDIGQVILRSAYVPLVVAAPVLKRYVVFGNLFAGVGGETYRLDRHPTMSRHPITPMLESDLRRHLALQTDKPVGLVDLLTLAQGDAAVDAAITRVRDEGAEVILFDTVDAGHLRAIGRVLWEQAAPRGQFVVGSSGVEYALTAYLHHVGLVAPIAPPPAPPEVAQLVVMAGSAAPMTAAQIGYAVEQGYTAIRLNAPALIDPARAAEASSAAQTAALVALGRGASVVLYAACGPDDPALAATRTRARELGLAEQEVGQRLARAQGQLLARVLAATRLRRACVAGGDTSGYVARGLGIYALEMTTPVSPGAPLCRAYSSVAAFDGMEISLKGGQNGQADYFEQIRRGGKP